MLTVIIVVDKDHKYLQKTIDGLNSQKCKDFDYIIMNPNQENISGLKVFDSPSGINNQINTGVYHTKSKYYAVICSGCVPCYTWTEDILINDYLDGIVGRVYLSSQNEPSEEIIKPNSYNLGECDSQESGNYNNICFSYKAFVQHGGLNAIENTQQYFVKQFNFSYLHYISVDKIIDLNTKLMNNIYRINTDKIPEYVQWKDTKEDIPAPKNKNLIITVSIGSDFREILSYTEESVFQYAKKIQADYIQIENTTQEWWGLEKFRVKEFCKNYDRILFIDSDIWIEEGTPNIFDYVPVGHIGIHNDWKYNGDGTINTNDWILQEAKEMCFYQNTPYINSQAYNSGVIVLDKEHIDIWNPPRKSFLAKHCSEQHWVEQNIRRLNIPVFELDRKWNNQTWTPTFNEKDSYFTHYSGINQKDKINKLFLRFHKNFCKIQDGTLCYFEKRKLSNLQIKNKENCVLTLSVSGYDPILEQTKDSHKKYADKIDADYIIIKENLYPEWPMSNKYLIEEYTKRYNKTLYIDCDIYIKNNSPNILDMVPENEFGIHDEEYEVSKTSYKKHVDFQLDCVYRVLKFEKSATPRSLNCGVMVISNLMSELYSLPNSGFPAFWCFDQHYLYLNLIKNNINQFEIGEKFNWEYIREDWEEKLDDAYFIHFNGIKSVSKRLFLINKVKTRYEK